MLHVLVVMGYVHVWGYMYCLATRRFPYVHVAVSYSGTSKLYIYYPPCLNIDSKY